MVTFNDKESLDSFLMDLLGRIINDVSEAVLNKLRENIIEYTYTYGGENQSYFNGSGEPTFEFLNSFELTEIESQVNGWVRDIVYDYANMTVQLPTNGGLPAHAHYSEGGALIDTRPKLADILNVDGVAGHKERRRFFEPTVEWAEQNIESLVVKSARRQGVYLE